MIHFKTIRWKNFLSTGNQFTEVILDKTPTTLIVGENGSGKSTILDALTFSLFGKPFRRVNKGQLVNSVNNGGTLTEVEFDVGSKRYMVKRGIKKNIFEIYVDGKRLNQDAKIADQQEYLENTILKLNYKSFTQIVILGSASFTPFMQLKATDRRTIIEDLLDIQIFSVMNGLLRSRMSENKESVLNNDVHLELTEGKLATTQELINDIRKTKSNQIDKNLQDIEKNEIESKKLSESVEELLEIISSDSSIDEFNKLEKYRDGIERNILKAEKEIEFYEQNDTCGTCNQELDEEHKSNMISEHHGKMHAWSDGLMTLSGKISGVKIKMDEITKLQSTVSQKQIQIQGINQYINKLKTQILEIEDREDDIDEKNKTLKELKEELKLCQTKKEQLSFKKQLYETASVLLKDSGIKTRIIKQYLPIMNRLINKYLAAMDFFVSFTLDESFNESIKSRHRDEFTYDSFSEGEKMRIDLALLFTWRTIAKMKNSVNTNLLILDEVFDSSLDANGTDEFLAIINNLQGKQNVFVISHKGDALTDKFRNKITFEKYKNFSRII